MHHWLIRKTCHVRQSCGASALWDTVDAIGVGGQRVVGLEGPRVKPRCMEDGVDELGAPAYQRRVEVDFAGHAPRLIGRPEQVRRARLETVGTVPPADLQSSRQRASEKQ